MLSTRRVDLVERITGAFAAEIDLHDPGEAVGWRRWPDVRTLVGHLGGVHAWAAEILRTGDPVADPTDVPAPGGSAHAWYLEQRADLLGALRSVPGERACWVFAGDDFRAEFWRRRMVFESTKHLIDLRSAGGGSWRSADELSVNDSADGIDELFEVFLHRSRPGLVALPGPVVLDASDSDRSWTVQPNWTVQPDRTVQRAPVAGAARVRARTADLALLVWDRADPLTDHARFEVTGDPLSIAAFRDAPIHV